jgi:hypothetical protein
MSQRAKPQPHHLSPERGLRVSVEPGDGHLHDDVAASTSDIRESVRRENATDFLA